MSERRKLVSSFNSFQLLPESLPLPSVGSVDGEDRKGRGDEIRSVDDSVGSRGEAAGWVSSLEVTIG